jgi:hypothetical protein
MLMTQTLCRYLIWMWEWVWGRCQPEPWRNGVISTPQVTQKSKISGKFGQCNNMMVHLFLIDTAYRSLTYYMHLIWIQEGLWGGCQPQPWRNGVISTQQVTQKPKFWDNLACETTWWCTHMPLRQHNNDSNTFYISNMDVWSGLRLMSASTIEEICP